jgi:hypothetical protein
VAMFNDVVHLSIRRKWSAQVDERSSVWRSRGISTKELLNKGQWQWMAFRSMPTRVLALWDRPSSE